MRAPMRSVDVIRLKRDGHTIDAQTLTQFSKDYLENKVSDYQMSAFLMAVVFNGLSADELHTLTETMISSGERLDWSSHPQPKIDKHSTGGVGDKTSLIIAPLVAEMGIIVPMISGRGLGHTGGTLDKLGSIPGFSTEIDSHKAQSLLQTVGVAFMAQTDAMVPLDKRLYALRDVTGTVECIPLIAASIMSKKIAEGINGLALDVKMGSGAFMKSLDQAEQLSKTLIGIGERFGIRTTALITNMDQPLGCAVGNALEVEEAVEVLKGHGPKDVLDLSLELSAEMCVLAGVAKATDEVLPRLQRLIDNGRALERLKKIINAHGGNVKTIDDPYHTLSQSKFHEVVALNSKGYVHAMNTQAIGIASSILGAGRQMMTDAIDPAVGLEVHKKVGDPVEPNEPVVTIFHNGRNVPEARRIIVEAYKLSNNPPKPIPMIIKKVAYENRT